MGLRSERKRRLITQVGAAAAGMTLTLLAFGVVTSELAGAPPAGDRAARDTDGGKADPSRKDAPPPRVKLGLAINDPRAFRGYTLLAPLKSEKTYLMDMEGRAIRTWKSESHPALSAYLLENGHLLRPAELRDQPFGGGPGAGGRIQEFTWDGQLVWDYKFANENQLPHHDIARLPNGNVLMIAWEKKTEDEAIAAGRKPELTGDRPLQLDCILEVKPTGRTTGEIVWEWHLWDHLIQDHDPARANYGKVADHPERVDINYEDNPLAAMVTTKAGLDKLRSIGYLGGSPTAKTPPRIDPDWTHINGVDYNPELDQVALSVHGFSEVWIIDHSTTKAEAAGHEGGRSGMGGDLLYRWGNPRTYRAGTAADQKLFHQHNAHWIPKGRPGAGHILVFNNGMRRPDAEYSSIEEFVPPVMADGRYTRKEGASFGPGKPVWSYSAPKKSDFFSALISGAQRLPNGNTLICSGNNGTLFEVTPDGDIVWKYVNPVKETGGPPGWMGGPPPLVDLLPFFLKDMLDLSSSQRRDLDALQKDISDRLKETLTDKQMKQLIERKGPGPGGPGGFTPPGQLMALSTQITLKLTPQQRTQVQALQKRIDDKLGTLLTDKQKARFKQMKHDFARGGPAGPGPGGPPGFGPGGPPPGFGPGGPPGFGGPPGGSGVFRAYRYAPDYPGLAGKDLTPGKTVEELEAGEPEAKSER